MERDYSKLLAAILQKYGTRKNFAKAMDISLATLLMKLGSKSSFTQNEIERACDLLEIDYLEIPMYFFEYRV